jgi:hypothetical protein
MLRLFALSVLLVAQVHAAPLYVLSARGEIPLHALDVNIDVQQSLIRTRLDMTFINPYDEAVAATFIFALPKGANLDAYSIGRDHARPAQYPPAPPQAPEGWDFYEDLPYIPAHQTQRVSFTYVQSLAGKPRVYWLPLKGLLRLRELNITVHRKHAPVPVKMPVAYPFKSDENSLSLSLQNFLPEEDIVFGLAWPPPPNPELRKIRKTKSALEKIIAENARMSGNNQALQGELENTRAQLREVEQQLQNMLEQQHRLLDDLEQEFVKP